MAARPPVSAVLLQVRQDVGARDHERVCFIESCGLEEGELDAVDMVREDVSWERIRHGDVFFIGGSGEFSATADHAFTPALTDLTLRLVDDSRPLLGSCWGHHFLARVLGGRVVTDEERSEVGSFEVDLTAEGSADPLFDDLPERMTVHLGHHDRVDSLPEGAIELAFSERCRNQALRLVGKPIYGTQFHSEMNERHMRERLLMYRDSYLPDGMTVDDFNQMLRPTPHAAGILRRFMDLYT